MQQITATSQLEAGATIQRMEDNETRRVAEVERDEDGRITAIMLANRGGLYGEPDVLTGNEITGWVIL